MNNDKNTWALTTSKGIIAYKMCKTPQRKMLVGKNTLLNQNLISVISKRRLVGIFKRNWGAPEVTAHFSCSCFILIWMNEKRSANVEVNTVPAGDGTNWFIKSSTRAIFEHSLWCYNTLYALTLFYYVQTVFFLLFRHWRTSNHHKMQKNLRRVGGKLTLRSPFWMGQLLEPLSYLFN